MKNYFFLITTCFLLSLSSCEHDDATRASKQAAQAERVGSGPVSRFPQLSKMLSELRSRSVTSRGLADYNIGEIDSVHVVEYRDRNNVMTYALNINLHDPSEKVIENLILTPTAMGTMGYIMRYELDGSWLATHDLSKNMNQYTGRILKYDLYRNLLFEKTVVNGNFTTVYDINAKNIRVSCYYLPVESCSFGNHDETTGYANCEGYDVTYLFLGCTGGGGGSMDDDDYSPAVGNSSGYPVNPIGSGTSGTHVGGGGGISVGTTPTPFNYMSAETARRLRQKNFTQQQLTPQQRAQFLNLSTDRREGIMSYLESTASSNGLFSLATQYSPASINFAIWAINFLANHSSTTWDRFKNAFLGESEGMDYGGDAPDDQFWNNPSTTFSAQTLPSLAVFSANFPSKNNPLYSDWQKMANTVGGQPKTILFGNPDKANTCALRISYALLRSGIQIPNIPGKTFLGDDGNYYFLGAIHLLSWMKKTFGASQWLLNDDYAGVNGEGYQSTLAGATGIYIMIPNLPGGCEEGFGFCSSGHADLMVNGNCDSACYFNPEGGVKNIYLWVLN